MAGHLTFSEADHHRGNRQPEGLPHHGRVCTASRPRSCRPTANTVGPSSPRPVRSRHRGAGDDQPGRPYDQQGAVGTGLAHQGRPAVGYQVAGHRVRQAGVRVNAVAPGIIQTPMHDPESYDGLAGLHPVGRMGRISEIIDGVLYLQKRPVRCRRGPAHRRRPERRSLTCRQRESGAVMPIAARVKEIQTRSPGREWTGVAFYYPAGKWPKASAEATRWAPGRAAPCGAPAAS
jgi:hypothetical protein